MSDFVAHKEEYTIRLGRPDDYERIAAVELAAGKAFVEIDMAAIANDEPPMRAEIEARCEKGHLWVTVGPDDHAVAYLMIDLMRDAVHIEQVSVAPAHAGQKLGKGLIDTVLVWAKDCGLRAQLRHPHDISRCAVEHALLRTSWFSTNIRRISFR